MLIAVGRLELRAGTNRLWFGIVTWLALRQALRAPGCQGVRARGENDRVYWSLSAWESAAAMRDYRNSGAHARAMRLFGAGSRTRFVQFEADTIPDWPEAMRRLELQESSRSSSTAS